MKKYQGLNCGCCGAWIPEPFEVPEYLADPWWDGWGLCPEGKCRPIEESTYRPKGKKK